MPENAEKFICEICDFKCSKHSNYTTHLLTAKHKKRTKLNIFEQKNADPKYVCKYCEKVYKARNSLWYHENKCEKQEENKLLDPTKFLDDENKLISLILDVVKSNSELQKQNQEFQQQMLEMCKNGINNNSITQVNSNNKTFNLQVFLNEQCKDAMNIMEFVDSIKLDLDDAESVRKLGYVNGISNIIIKHLKALDVHMRPVHCTDLKRETMYVKFQDVWEKEGDENKLIRRAIKHIAIKNYNAAETFKDVHPDCMDLESKYGEHFLRLKIEALGGSGNDNYESHTKIIKKIAKEVTIDKTL
jgi:hypothetical protein